MHRLSPVKCQLPSQKAPSASRANHRRRQWPNQNTEDLVSKTFPFPILTPYRYLSLSSLLVSFASIITRSHLQFLFTQGYRFISGLFMMYLPCLLTIIFFWLQLLLSVFVTCMSPENIEELLKIHNRFRKAIASRQSNYTVSNMNTLEWSDRLSALAEGNITCDSARPEQVQAARLGFIRVRVNVGRGRSGNGSLTRVVRSWFNERSKYRPADRACFPPGGCQKYKNMINAQHRLMGCAMLDGCESPRKILKVNLMCLYEGGEPDQFQFLLGKPCTGCKHPMSFCKNKMCVSCNPSTEECNCKKSCKKRGVGLGQLHTTNCSCTCTYGIGPNCEQPCQNSNNMFNNDYDVCIILSPEDCNDPTNGESFRELCPETCGCKRFPNSVT